MAKNDTPEQLRLFLKRHKAVITQLRARRRELEGDLQQLDYALQLVANIEVRATELEWLRTT
jgi:hypothetical protein